MKERTRRASRRMLMTPSPGTTLYVMERATVVASPSSMATSAQCHGSEKNFRPPRVDRKKSASDKKKSEVAMRSRINARHP